MCNQTRGWTRLFVTPPFPSNSFHLSVSQVADTLWHNLEDLKDGLIEMLAETTFDGDFNVAHDLADFGGDVLGVTEWDTSYANKW